MASIEFVLGGQKYDLKSEESEEHLREVSELVRRKIESLRKKNPHLTLQKATMLAALDFASASIKGRKKSLDYRATLLAKSQQLLEKLQAELTAKPDRSLC